jgi:transcription antitermination factor NusG
MHDEVIGTIKEGMEDGNIVVIRPQRFEGGERVFIREGPFKDFYGIFEREIKGHERVMILLDSISYKLEIDSWVLAKG